MPKLNDKEKEIIQCFAKTWAAEGGLLPGDISYQEAFDLLAKLGIDPEPFRLDLERLIK